MPTEVFTLKKRSSIRPSRARSCKPACEGASNKRGIAESSYQEVYTKGARIHQGQRQAADPEPPEEDRGAGTGSPTHGRGGSLLCGDPHPDSEHRLRLREGSAHPSYRPRRALRKGGHRGWQS